nr:type II toxin-antitoxin system Phd/YefM family antitoxin [Levilactobacillus mulengensis]
MMKNPYVPTHDQRELISLMKQANSNAEAVKIEPADGGKGAFVVGEDEWKAIQETLFLISHGVDKQIQDRSDDSNEDFDRAWQSI